MYSKGAGLTEAMNKNCLEFSWLRLSIFTLNSKLISRLESNEANFNA